MSSTPRPPSPASLADSGVVATFLPNRGRARFLSGVVRLFLAFGVLASVSALWGAFTEWYARLTWPAANGEILSVEQKDSKGIPGSGRYTRYWLEYQVRFAVPREQCLTGTTWDYKDAPNSMVCGGVVRTRSTRSPQTVFAWLLHTQPPNAPVRVLHDPNGPSLKIAGDSIWLAYRWDDILLAFIWTAVFLALDAVIRRRLKFLGTLPENYDASPPVPPSENPNELIDLKLS